MLSNEKLNMILIILKDMEKTASWFTYYDEVNHIKGMFRISSEDVLSWARQIREVINGKIAPFEIQTTFKPTNFCCGRCRKDIQPGEEYESCGSTGNPDNPSEILWYHNTKDCHGIWREEKYRKINTMIECEDCGVKTDDLITKSDHHGGMKTVCINRDACHARGG